MNLSEALDKVEKGYAVRHNGTGIRLYKPVKNSKVKQGVFVHIAEDAWFTKLTLNTVPIEEQFVVKDPFIGAFLVPITFFANYLPDTGYWELVHEIEMLKLSKGDVLA